MTCRMTPGVLLTLTCAAAMPAIPGALNGQSISARRSEGAVLALPDSRLAVIQDTPDGTAVVSLVGSVTTTPPTNLREGDLVLAINDSTIGTFGDVSRVVDPLATGASIRLKLRRGRADLTVTYAKPAPRAGEGMQMIVGTGSELQGGGAGVWSVQGTPSNVKEVIIGGIHVIENRQGMPEVSFKAAHPASARIDLRSGDVVTRFNGRGIAALAGLEKYLKEAPAGSNITLSVTRRDGSETTVTFPKPST